MNRIWDPICGSESQKKLFQNQHEWFFFRRYKKIRLNEKWPGFSIDILSSFIKHHESISSMKIIILLRILYSLFRILPRNLAKNIFLNQFRIPLKTCMSYYLLELLQKIGRTLYFSLSSKVTFRRILYLWSYKEDIIETSILLLSASVLWFLMCKTTKDHMSIDYFKLHVISNLLCSLKMWVGLRLTELFTKEIFNIYGIRRFLY